MDKDIKVAIVGAGRTGRGFIARLFHKQADIVFIDTDKSLVENLRCQGGYVVRYFDGRQPDYIDGYSAYTPDESVAAIYECSVIFVSIGAENARAAEVWLSDKINPGACVILCENAPRPADLFTGALSERACSAAVFCTTVGDGELDIQSENYPCLYTDDRISETAAGLDGIISVPDFDILMIRKIYTYNAASAVIAYLGAKKGYCEYPDAANDAEIARELDSFYAEINCAICAEYGIDPREQAEFAELSRRKFQNRAIKDSVERNAANPARKLSAGERIIAPARLILKHGGSADALVKTAAAAIEYMGAKDAREAERVLTDICSINMNESIFGKIMSWLNYK